MIKEYAKKFSKGVNIISLKRKIQIVKKKFTDSSVKKDSKALPEVYNQNDISYLRSEAFLYALCIKGGILFDQNEQLLSFPFKDDFKEAILTLLCEEETKGQREYWFLSALFMLNSIYDELLELEEYESDYEKWSSRIDENIQFFGGIEFVENMRREIACGLESSLKYYKGKGVKKDILDSCLVGIYANSFNTQYKKS